MKNKLRCFYCGKLYTTEQKARECEDKHDVVFVPILREDLNRLVNFIATGDRSLLTERLSRLLFKYFRAKP
jgi:predicted nucleic acid-binding protein